MTTDRQPPDAARGAALACCWAMIGTVMVFSIAQGFTYPLLTFILKQSGHTAGVIAVSAAMTPLGVITSAPWITRYGSRIDRKAILLAALLLVGVTLWCLAITPVALWWLPLRFLLGIWINVIYVLSETTLLQLAPAEFRGRLVGSYTAITTLGYALGPLLMVSAHRDEFGAFTVLSGILLFAMLPLAFAPLPRFATPQREACPPSPLLTFAAAGWPLLSAYAATTLFDNGFMSLFPSYGVDLGMSERSIVTMLGAIFFGGVVIQIPIGWALDKLSAFTALAVCAALGTAGFLLVPVILPRSPAGALAGFIWGGAILGIQTITLSELGRRYRGPMLTAGNAAFGMMWGASAVIGIPIAGVAMDHVGPSGLFVVIGGAFVAAVACLLLCSWKEHPASALDKT